ncbi:hypothetical protein PR048_019594 [Dryococelus australis]|uniref:Uncharacterized protein n=1 Tax=Dryococelus australis TaxID=614101 RepID=A0ABQ9H3W1_9NEOP|nr:hypothetical protein PR048_019594 [Dryococelus australis]
MRHLQQVSGRCKKLYKKNYCGSVGRQLTINQMQTTKIRDTERGTQNKSTKRRRQELKVRKIEQTKLSQWTLKNVAVPNITTNDV